MADLKDSLNTAAAKPTHDTPLTAIETRLRRRHRLRQAAVGVCTIALVGAIGGGIALSSGDSPSIKTGLPAAAAQVTGGDPALTITLPDGWVESNPAWRDDNEVFTVGTALLPDDVRHDVCLTDPAYQDDVFVQLKEFTGVVLLEQELSTTTLPPGTPPPSSEEPVAPLQQTVLPFEQRPADFSRATPSTEAQCVRPGNDVTTAPLTQEFQFRENGRWLDAIIGIGVNATPEQHAQAYAVLNSLVVAPLPDTPQPSVATTIPPSTVPPSADAEAIAAAFEGWVAAPPPDFTGAEAFVEDWASIVGTARRAAEDVGNPQCYTGHVDAITRIDEDDADVIFSFLCDGQPAVPNHAQGRAVKIDGVWMVSRDTVCETFAIGAQRCPPRE